MGDHQPTGAERELHDRTRRTERRCLTDDAQREALRVQGLAGLGGDNMSMDMHRIAQLGIEMRETGDALLAQDEAEEEIRLEGDKPVGAPPHDVKRFYLDTKVKTICPSCGAECVQDLADIPLSYPEYNTPFHWTSYCDECHDEWQTDAQLILHVELQVIP